LLSATENRNAKEARVALVSLEDEVKRLHGGIASQTDRAVRRIQASNAFAAATFAVLAVTLAGLWFTRRRLRRQLPKPSSESSAAGLEKFAARIAHDVLSPLQSVSTALDIAAATQDPEKLRRCERSGKAGLRRVQTVMDGLVDFARADHPPEPATSPAVVSAAVHSVLAELADLARAENIELRAELGAPEAAVDMELRSLQNILRHLVRNAVQYMSDPGERWVRVSVVASPSHVRLEVQDSGAGIPGSELPRLFEPYVRPKGLKKTGLGLGLATVKKLVEAHSGSVSLRPVAGLGACFVVELPRATEGAQTERPPTYLS